MAAQQQIKLADDSILAEAEFSRGIVRDLPRSSIPVGGLYDSVDFMVDKVGLLYKRGGTTYQGTTVGATTTGVGFVCAPEFPTGLKVFALGADGHVWDVTSTSVDAGALGITTVDNPHLYVDKVVVPSSDGITAPKKITAPAGVLAIANWGGTPPSGRIATVHLSRVILGNSASQPNRVYFSPVPDPETTWDSNAYIDTNHSLTGLCPCQGILLAFSGGHTERIVGDVPPATIGENMSVQPVGEMGCVDARSIAAWRGNVIFAGQGGVWVTNGVGFDSLIEKDDGSGIASYWREIYDVTADNGGIFAGGIFARDYYFLSLSYGATMVDTLLCFLPRKAWTRLSNVGVRSYASSVLGVNELFGGTISGMPGNRVVKLSSMFDPAEANISDADGSAVEPQVQLRMIGEGIGQKAYGHGHITYDMRMNSSNLAPNPGFEVDLTDWTASGIFSVTLTRETADPHSGVGYARMVSDSPGVNYLVGSQFAVTAGVTYQVSVWGRVTSATSVSSLLAVHWFTGVTEIDLSVGSSVPLSETWEWKVEQFTAPPGADHAYIRVVQTLSVIGGDTTEYDDFDFSAATSLGISASIGIENDSGFTTVAEGSPLTETVRVTRRRFMVNRDGQTLNLFLQQDGASTETQVYAIEQEVRSYNPTADG